jgi:hypothetical protein
VLTSHWLVTEGPVGTVVFPAMMLAGYASDFDGDFDDIGD